MAKIVDCSVPNCPTPKIVVQDIPPTPVPKIDIGDLSAFSDEMEIFFKKKTSLLKSKETNSISEKELLSFLEYLKEKNKGELMSIKTNSNIESNVSEGYIVVYCDAGHKNIITT